MPPPPRTAPPPPVANYNWESRWESEWEIKWEWAAERQWVWVCGVSVSVSIDPMMNKWMRMQSDRRRWQERGVWSGVGGDPQWQATIISAICHCRCSSKWFSAFCSALVCLAFYSGAPSPRPKLTERQRRRQRHSQMLADILYYLYIGDICDMRACLLYK